MAQGSERLEYDVFLSHSAFDSDVVRDIAERLRADGLHVWFDEWMIEAGDNIQFKIEDGLERSRVLVLFMSAHASASDWTKLEAGTFRFRDPLNKDRCFIPVRLDDSPMTGSLSQFRYIDWCDVDDESYVKLRTACLSARAGIDDEHSEKETKGPGDRRWHCRVAQTTNGVLSRISFTSRRGNVIATTLAGAAIFLFLAIVVFALPEPTTFQRAVLRFFIAVGAGIFPASLLGGIRLAGVQVGPALGLLFFILIQFAVDPLKLQALTADVAPGVVPRSQEVKEAQELLSKLGEYDGAVDGVPGSLTRAAIKNFQAKSGLSKTGYLDESTEQAFREAEELVSVFEGVDFETSAEDRSKVDSIRKEYGLNSSIAYPAVLDTIVHSGFSNARRFADEASKSLGGSPVNGLSERAWLLAFLEARKTHLNERMPQLAGAIDKNRLSKIRAQVEALPD